MSIQAVPGSVAWHATIVGLTLFTGFLCAFALLRAKERRGPATLPRWKGPISLAWAVTVLCAALLLGLTFVGIRLQRPYTIEEIDEQDDGAEAARHSLGRGLFQVSVLVFPAVAVLTWIGLGRQARRRDVVPARHSTLALLGLILSAAGLLAFLLTCGASLLK